MRDEMIFIDVIASPAFWGSWLMCLLDRIAIVIAIAIAIIWMLCRVFLGRTLIEMVQAMKNKKAR
jgi:hypothetical protein